MLLVLSGCPKTVPPPLEPPPVRKGPTAEEKRAKAVAAVEAEALALVKEEDELLWAHWTRGDPLELEKPASKHAALFEDRTLALVREGGNKPLLDWLLGERLARATAEANATLTGQEEIAKFTFDEKPLQWRDLNRLLGNEKSAVKRKALWAASRETIAALAEGYQKRDEAVAAALTALGTTAAERAGLTTEESAALGKKLLEDTEAEWKRLVEQLGKSELGLPADKLTRADLPRMLRPSTAADASFPKADQAAKATALLEALGLYGLPGLTLDLAESAKKNPLPLTVAPGGPEDVRVSFRPAGGAHEASVLLGEVGRGLALREIGESRLSTPLLADASFRLFAELASDAAWLKSQGVADAAAASAINSSRALRLFTLRRAAGNLIAQHEAQGQADDAAASSWRTWSARALGVEVPTEDAARWRLERDPLLRAVGMIRAALLAEQLRGKLSPQWWANPGSTVTLRTAWGRGPQRAEPVKAPADAGIVRSDAGAL